MKSCLKKVCLSVFLVMAVVAAAVLPIEGRAIASANDLSWIAFGDLRGYLEPCGCDPKTDMGGLKRLAAYVHRERAMDRGTLVFSLGNNFPPIIGNASDASKLKAPFFAEAMGELKPLASLANETEIQWAVGFPDQKLQKLSDLQVLSNASKSFAKREFFLPVVSGDQALVFGYVWNERLKTMVEPYSAALASQWRNEIRKSNPVKGALKKKTVLLFAGPDEHLNKILNQKVFDLVISSNRSTLAMEPGVGEKEQPRKLIVRSGSKVGESEILMVPLGGQGIIRGGLARSNEAKPLADLIGVGSPGMTPKKPSVLPIGGQLFVAWLEPGQEADHFEDLFKRYRAATGVQFEAHNKQRLLDLAVTPFAGADACKQCHASAYESWKTSNHASAYETLRKKDVHTDMECVSCHVVGAKEIGGFVSLAATANFAGVQCENCHGPRKEHVANPTIKPVSDPKGACVSCHKTPHSSSFKYEDYWPRIKHGR